MEDLKETLTLNGKPISKEKLEEKREQLKTQSGAKLEEVSKGNFRIKLQG